MRWPAICRLRQICLVAPHLEPVISDIAAIMGLNVCYRDGNVAKYGLENALLPVDTILLEVVAPSQPGTAAGRFLDKTGGRGGYMAIFCCDDPDARGKHANGDGRAHRQRDHARALSRRATASARLPRRLHRVQPHRRQRRCAGAYPPAGPDWQKSIRKDVTLALTEVEMQSPDPQGLAEHWGKIIGLAVSKSASGEPELKLPNASFRFVKGASDLMSGLTFKVADIAKVRDAAKAKGCKVSGDTFDLCGVTFRAGGVSVCCFPLPLWERVDQSTRSGLSG